MSDPFFEPQPNKPNFGNTNDPFFQAQPNNPNFGNTNDPFFKEQDRLNKLKKKSATPKKVDGTQTDDQSNQGVKLLTYPIDISNYPNANVVMFSILQTSDIGISQQSVRGSGQDVSKNIKQTVTGGKELNAPNIVDNIHNASQAIPKTINEVLGKLGDSMNFNSYVPRTRTIICLPIPDMDTKSDYSLNYQTSNLGLAGNLVNNLYSGGGISQFIKNASGSAARYALGAAGTVLQGTLGRDVGDINGTIESATRSVYNPKLELLFKSVDLRCFAFTYSFAPSSKSEAELLHNIVKEFRMAATPGLNPNGFYMTYPFEIDVKYMFRGGENQYLPKIARCCITKINTSYDRSLLNNGCPAIINIRLEVMEILQQMRADINNEF